MVYMSARTGSFLGLKYLDTIIAMACSEMSFGGGRVVWRPVDSFALPAS